MPRWIVRFLIRRGIQAYAGHTPSMRPGLVPTSACATVSVAIALATSAAAASVPAPVRVAGGGSTAIATSLPHTSATAAQLGEPEGIAAGPGGTLLIADAGLNAVLRVNADGTIERLVGTGSAGCMSTFAAGGSYALTQPSAVAVLPNDVLIADAGCHRIRRANGPDPPLVYNSAGDSPGGYTDATPAGDAAFETPTDVEPISSTVYLVAAPLNNAVRQVDMTADAVTTVDTGTVLGAPADISSGGGSLHYVAAYWNGGAGSARVWRVSNGAITLAAG